MHLTSGLSISSLYDLREIDLPQETFPRLQFLQHLIAGDAQHYTAKPAPCQCLVIPNAISYILTLSPQRPCVKGLVPKVAIIGPGTKKEITGTLVTSFKEGGGPGASSSSSLPHQFVSPYSITVTIPHLPHQRRKAMDGSARW